MGSECLKSLVGILRKVNISSFIMVMADKGMNFSNDVIIIRWHGAESPTIRH